MHNAFVEAFVSAVCCGRRRSTLEPEALRAADERWNNCGNRASTPPAAYHRYANECKLSTKTPKMSLMFELSLGVFFCIFCAVIRLARASCGEGTGYMIRALEIMKSILTTSLLAVFRCCVVRKADQ